MWFGNTLDFSQRKRPLNSLCELAAGVIMAADGVFYIETLELDADAGSPEDRMFLLRFLSIETILITEVKIT